MLEHLVPSIRLNSGLCLAAVASRREEIRTLFSRDQRCRTFANWENVIDHPEIDAIICAGPPLFNERVVERAIDLAKPIFTEKPCSSNSLVLARLAGNESQAGCLVQVGYNFLFSDGFLSLKQKQADFGPIKSLDIGFLTNKPRAPLWVDESTFRSFLYAIAIHPIAMALDLFQDFPSYSVNVQDICVNQFNVRILCRGEEKTISVEAGNHSDRFEFHLRAIYQSGQTVVFNSANPHQLTLTVPCADGGDGTGGMQRVIERIALSGHTPDRDGRGYEREVETFANFARNRKANGLQLVDSLPIHALIENILTEYGNTV